MSHPDPNADRVHPDSTEGPRHRTPPWVKGFLVAAAVLVVVFAVLHLSGGGMVMNHTP